MSKSRDAFRTISEVSDWLDTPAHVLRFWESKFTQIKPVKRAGGRRYYRPDDMALLSGIKYLLHEQGMTIKGAQKLLREQGVRHVAEMGQLPPSQGDEVIDAELAAPPPGPEPIEAAEIEAEAVMETPQAPASRDPATWDPDDPWPADPPGVAADDPFRTFDDRADPVPDDSVAEPTKAEPVMPPPRHEVSLPFARARAEASRQPEAQPGGQIMSFGRAVGKALPDMPNEAAIAGHPGALTALIGADRAVLRTNAARIAPLVSRLKVLSDRIGGPGR